MSEDGEGLTYGTSRVEPDKYSASDLARMLIEYAAQRRYASFEPAPEDEEDIHILHARLRALSLALGFEQSPKQILYGGEVITEVGERDPVVFHALLKPAFPRVENLEKVLTFAMEDGMWSKALDCNRALAQFFKLRAHLHDIETFNDDWFANATSMNMTIHAALVASHIRDANAPFVAALDDALGYLLDPSGRTFTVEALVQNWHWPQEELSQSAESFFALHDALIGFLTESQQTAPHLDDQEE